MKTFLVANILTTLAVIGALSWGPRSRADTLVVPAGFDLFETVPGSAPDLGTWFDAPSLPLGFFGMKSGIPSDPTPPGRVFFMGLPTGPLGNPPSAFTPDPFPEDDPLAAAQHFVRPPVHPAQTDTIVQRLGTATLPNIGDSDTVPIEIISLSLVSVNPIMVSYGGFNPSFFDVFVDLAPIPQNVGSMVLRKTHPNGGTFDSLLPVNVRLRFIGTSPTDPTASEVPSVPKEFESAGVPWIIPEPSTFLLAAFGLLGLGCYGWRLRQNVA